jgi:IS5 family transposase
MDRVEPWPDLVALVEPYLPEGGRRGQQPFVAETMPHIYFLQQ